MKWILSFCLVLTLIACRKSINSDVLQINPLSFKSKGISLSKLADNIEYVFIDSTIKISNITNIKFADDFFLIGTGGEGLLMYNKTGRYINSIGRIGNGPGEYQYALHFDIDTVHKRIYLLSLKKILVYNFSGRFTKSISLSNDEPSSDIAFFNHHLFLFDEINYGRARYNWIEMDTLGNVCSSKLNSIPTFHTTLFFSAPIFRNSRSLYYWNHYNDTIFQINANSIDFKYLFSPGDFRFAPKCYHILESNFPSFIPIRFVESSKYLFFYYSFKDKLCNAVLDKLSSNFFLVNESRDIEKRWAGPGIINDIDGGIPFSPYTSYSENGDSYIIGWSFAYEFKSWASSENFKKSTPKYLKKKKEFEKLANSLSENDNPVLMLIKLKE